MRINVQDFNTSLAESQQSTPNPLLSKDQHQIFTRVKKNYQKLNLASLFRISGNNHSYQTYVLCTQAVLAICHFLSFFSVALLFASPDFSCYTSLNNLKICNREEACSSRYGYKIQARYLGILENFGLECSQDFFVVNMQVTMLLLISLILGGFFLFASRLGRKTNLILSSALQMWGNLIICFSLNFYNALFGVSIVIIGFTLWAVYFFIYVYEILEKKAVSLACALVFLLGSLGLFVNLLIVTILKDYRAVCIFCMLVHSISALLYFEYMESPVFCYFTRTLGAFYTSLKFILQSNFATSQAENRGNALKAIMFNTDDSSFWISNLLEGKLPISARPKDLPKPSRHFLDDSQLEKSDISAWKSAKSSNPKTLSAKAPVDRETDLKILEQKLFNEGESCIKNKTVRLLYDITLDSPQQTRVFDFPTLKLILGSVFLLSYHILGIFMSHAFISKIKIYAEFWSNLLFALTIFAGFLSSSLIAPENHSNVITIIYLVSILIICLNFASIEYTEEPYENDRNYISIPHLMTLHALVISGVLASNFGFLVIYIISLFEISKRALVLGLGVISSFLAIAGLLFVDFAGIFEKGLELKLLFCFTLVNLMVAYCMPKDNSQKEKVKSQSEK